MDITTKLAEALQNMMGAFDNPLARRKMNDEFHEECRKSGREALAAYALTVAQEQANRRPNYFLTQIGFGADIMTSEHGGIHLTLPNAKTITEALTAAHVAAKGKDVSQLFYNGTIVWDASNGLLSNIWFTDIHLPTNIKG